MHVLLALLLSFFTCVGPLFLLPRITSWPTWPCSEGTLGTGTALRAAPQSGMLELDHVVRGSEAPVVVRWGLVKHEVI